MKIKVGQFDVLETGSLVGIDNEPIEFTLDETSQYIIRMVFTTTPDGQTAARADLYGKNGVLFTFTNYNNSLGLGSIIPIRVGQIKSRELYLAYRIYCLDGTAKHLHYTWYLGKEVKNG